VLFTSGFEKDFAIIHIQIHVRTTKEQAMLKLVVMKTYSVPADIFTQTISSICGVEYYIAKD